jgi:plastocyanin domain-containing protein
MPISSRRHLLRLSLLLALAGSLAGCSSCSSEAQAPISNHAVMMVTDKGFEPQNLRVQKGEPVTLVITRKSDATCATEIVIDEYGIKTALPLGKAVTVKFTPTKSGQLKYGCAMQKMIGGVIRVE